MSSVQQQDIYDSSLQPRRYPKNIQGKKNEWIGMEKHYGEHKDNLLSLENNINFQKKQEVQEALNDQLDTKDQIKQEQMRQKQTEFELSKQAEEMYKQQVRNEEEQQKLLQANLANNYSNQITSKQRAQQESMSQKLKDEQESIYRVQQHIKQLQQQNQQYKQSLQNLAFLEQESVRQKKLDELKSQQNSRDRFNEQVKENQLLEKMKEENYKNFYLRNQQYQMYQQNQHIQNVLNPQLVKQREQEENLIKNNQQYQQDQFQKFVNQQQQRYQNQLMTKEQNYHKIEEIEQEKAQQRLIRQQKDEQRQRELEEYNTYLQQMKQQKLSHQQQYNDALTNLNQQKIEQDKKNEQMTKQEKGFNKNDLYAFKRYDPNLYAMVPGWTPQIGGLTKNAQKKYFSQRDQYDNALSSKSVLMPKNINKPKDNFNLNQSVTDQQQDYPQSQKIASTKQFNGHYNVNGNSNQGYDLGNNNGNVNQTDRIGSKGQQQPPVVQSTKNIFYNQTKGKAYFLHNPITNPMPSNIQNPYILKNIYSNNPVKPTIFQTLGQNLTTPSQLHMGAYHRK